MEPVKTCATCRHSVVGRRDPMDWWKRRLCAHPGLVDRVEGRPIHEAESARGKEGPCGLSGALWEAQASVLGPGKVLVYPDKQRDLEKLTRIVGGDFRPDPVDERVDGYGMPAPDFDVEDIKYRATIVNTIPDTLLPRKPAKRARRRGDA